MVTLDVGGKEAFYSADRNEWRQWLEDHFQTSSEIWFVFPTVKSG